MNQITKLFYQENDPKTPFAVSYCVKVWNEVILTPEECKSLTTHIIEQEMDIISKNPEYKNDGGTGLGPNSITAKFQAYNMLQWEHPVCQTIKDKLAYGVNLMAPDFEEPVYAQMWANVLRSRQAIKPHQHACDEYSFLSANITLQAHNTQTVYQNPYGLNSVAFDNVPGTITMFPEYIIHWTTLHELHVPRVTLGVDLLPESAVDAHRTHKLVRIV